MVYEKRKQNVIFILLKYSSLCINLARTLLHEPSKIELELK